MPAAPDPAAEASAVLSQPLAPQWRSPWPEAGSLASDPSPALPAAGAESTPGAAPSRAAKPVSTPTSAVTPPAAALAQWWLAFDDPHLSRLIGQALQAHTSVRSAQAALQQARALDDRSAAAQGPQVQATASSQYAQEGSAAVATSAWRPGLDASWELDWFGQRQQARAATAAEARAVEAQVAQAQVSVVAEVALTFFEWRLQQQRWAVAQRRLALQEEFVQIVGWRLQAGLMSSQDLEQARLNLAQLRASLPEIEAAQGQALAALALLTGRNPQSGLDLHAAGPIPSPRLELARTIPADTLRQRPDVQRAQERLSAAVARAAQADAARLPTLALGGTLDWRSPRVRDLFDPAALTRTLLLRLSASLFDGGAARAQLQAQQAVLEQSRLELEAAVLTALREVEHALLALQASAQRLQHLQQAADAAAATEALALLRLTSGLIDYRIWLETRQNLLSAQYELSAARAAWSADHVRLYKALGGGWSAAKPQAALPEPHDPA